MTFDDVVKELRTVAPGDYPKESFKQITRRLLGAKAFSRTTITFKRELHQNFGFGTFSQTPLEDL